MAGLRIAVPVHRASVKQTTNITVFTNTVRIVLEATGPLAQGKMLAPALLLLNAKAVFEDFRNLPLGNLTAKSHVEDPADPNTDPVSGTPISYVPGWTGRWRMDRWHNQSGLADGPLGTQEMAGLTPEMARDDQHVWVRDPLVPRAPVPPSSGRMLRVTTGDFSAISMDAVDPNEGNVDMRVKFRMWEPGRDLVHPWTPAYNVDGSPIDQGIYPGHFEDSSNQVMLILSMDNGLQETGNENEIYGYALRNNWDEGPWPTSWGIPGFAWELVRFQGIQEIIEGQTGSEIREGALRRSVSRSTGQVRYSPYVKARRRVSPRNKKLYLDTRPDQRSIVLGEGTVVEVTSGWGDLYRPLVQNLGGSLVSAGPNPAGKGTINWNEIPGGSLADMQGTWMWARMTKTLEGEKVRLRAKVWPDGYDEPSTWQADILDSSDEALQGGYTGIGSATPIHAEPGQMGQARQTGPADYDQVIVQVPEVPVGTSVHFGAKPIGVTANAVTPDFINTGTLTRTWWDEYTVGTTPGDWFILRPGIGSAPDPDAVTNGDLKNKPLPADRLENFLLRVDPDLDPSKYLSDRSNVSLEHATRDLTDWIVWDPEESEVARMINPDMPRDALAWNEPFPGNPFEGHDGQIDDAEILVKFRADSWDQSVSFWLRASGAKGHETGYAITCVTENTLSVTQDEIADPDTELGSIGWAVYKYVDGERVSLGMITAPWRDQQWFWARIRVEGSSERQADRFRRINSSQSELGQPHDQYPYGGVEVSMRFWMDGEDESTAPWSSVLDDGHNPELETGFSGYRRHWDEFDEFRAAPNARFRPLVPPIDRGWFAIGGPSIGNTQRYAEIHVLSPQMPRLDSSAYDDVHNLLSLGAATGDASAWTVENADEIGSVDHPAFTGGQALEIKGNAASADGATPRLISNERVSVTPGEAYVALATLDNFQHQWVPGSWQNDSWFIDRYRGARVGLRWYDASGNVVPNVVHQHADVAYSAGSDSMRNGFTGARSPGRPHYVGEGFYGPEFGYTEFGNPATTSRSWYDLSRTDGAGDPYAGYAFPSDQPQPFRWQEKWRWMVHAGNLSHYVWQSYSWDEDGLVALNHPQKMPDAIGWSLPMLHVAPPGAVEAAVVVEIQNTQVIETVSFEPVIRVDYIGAQNRVVPGRPTTAYRDERYRVGEIGVFPAFREPAYESWNVQPGQFALPVEEVTEHAVVQGLEVEVHGHFSVEIEAPASASTQMFLPSTVRATKPQFSRPQQDVHDGGWTKQDGSNELIWSAIDDLAPSDADYAQSQQMPEDDLYVAQLTRMTNPDPDSTEKYLVHVRYRRRGATPATLVVALYQGETPIAEWEEVTDKTFATVVHELSPAQVASITDYADLRVRLTGDAVPV